MGGGWSMDHFPGGAPLRGALDAIVPDRPVLLVSRDHHSSWANTATMRLVRRVCDETVVMRRGEIVERGRTDELLGDPQHEYTRLLIDSVPKPGWDPEQAGAEVEDAGVDAPGWDGVADDDAEAASVGAAKVEASGQAR